MRARLAVSVCFLSIANALHAQTIAITGGTVYPVSGPKIENATVLVRDGRIVSVGAGIAVPAGAQRIDATGKWVTPGFINPWTSIGIVEIGLGAGPSDQGARGANNIAASFRPWDALNAASPLIIHTRLDGITSLGVVPAGNLISGQHAIIDLSGSTRDQLLRRAPSAMVAQLGNAAAGGTGARGELIGKLREVLTDARNWPRRRTAVEENRSRTLSATPADFDALQPVLA